MFGLEKTYGPGTKSSRSDNSSDVTKLEVIGWKQKHTLESYIDNLEK